MGGSPRATKPCNPFNWDWEPFSLRASSSTIYNQINTTKSPNNNLQKRYFDPPHSNKHSSQINIIGQIMLPFGNWFQEGVNFFLER